MNLSVLDIAQIASYVVPVGIAAWQALRARNYKQAADVVIGAIETAPPEIADKIKQRVHLASKTEDKEGLVDQVVQSSVLDSHANGRLGAYTRLLPMEDQDQ